MFEGGFFFIQIGVIFKLRDGYCNIFGGQGRFLCGGYSGGFLGLCLGWVGGGMRMVICRGSIGFILWGL